VAEHPPHHYYLLFDGVLFDGAHGGCRWFDGADIPEPPSDDFGTEAEDILACGLAVLGCGAAILGIGAATRAKGVAPVALGVAKPGVGAAVLETAGADVALVDAVAIVFSVGFCPTTPELMEFDPTGHGAVL
jgi:hypothetical protein